MSKELEAFNRVIRHCVFPYEEEIEKECLKDLNVIKNALKEKNEQDIVLKIVKGAITRELRNDVKFTPKDDETFDINVLVDYHLKLLREKEKELLRIWVLQNCFPKELKALEVIKSHKPTLVSNVGMCNSKEGIRHSILINGLTQEEYDLLKEVWL